MRKTLLKFVPLLFVLSACNTVTVTIPPASCAKLVPKTWKEGVEATNVPDPVPVAFGDLNARLVEEGKRWASAYVAASADTEKANGRTIDAIDIFENCEAMVNAARKP